MLTPKGERFRECVQVQLSCFYSPLAATVVTNPQFLIHTHTHKHSLHIQHLCLWYESRRERQAAARQREGALELGKAAADHRRPSTQVERMPGSQGQESLCVWFFFKMYFTSTEAPFIPHELGCEIWMWSSVSFWVLWLRVMHILTSLPFCYGYHKPIAVDCRSKMPL